MYNYFKLILGVVCLVMALFWAQSPVLAQSTAKGITCPATGTSIEAAPANGSRLTMVLLNSAGPSSVRFGGNNLGALPVLNDTNSTILLQGGSYSFSLPGLYYGRVICMSTTASPVTIHVSETTYP